MKEFCEVCTDVKCSRIKKGVYLKKPMVGQPTVVEGEIDDCPTLEETRANIENFSDIIDPEYLKEMLKKTK